MQQGGGAHNLHIGTLCLSQPFGHAVNPLDVIKAMYRVVRGVPPASGF
jgi:hypothetical protein